MPQGCRNSPSGLCSHSERSLRSCSACFEVSTQHLQTRGNLSQAVPGRTQQTRLRLHAAWPVSLSPRVPMQSCMALYPALGTFSIPCLPPLKPHTPLVLLHALLELQRLLAAQEQDEEMVWVGMQKLLCLSHGWNRAQCREESIGLCPLLPAVLPITGMSPSSEGGPQGIPVGLKNSEMNGASRASCSQDK